MAIQVLAEVVAVAEPAALAAVLLQEQLVKEIQAALETVVVIMAVVVAVRAVLVLVAAVVAAVLVVQAYLTVSQEFQKSMPQAAVVV